MKIQASIGLRGTPSSQRSLPSKYAQELRSQFGEKALLSYDDPRIETAETNFRAAVAGDDREKLWKALGALGEGWSVGSGEGWPVGSGEGWAVGSGLGWPVGRNVG